VSRDVIPLGPNQARSIWTESAPGAAASRLTVKVTVAGESARVWIDDLRVQGQRPALEAYVVKHLRFPRDPAPQR
jgi:hypothetical protein